MPPPPLPQRRATRPRPIRRRVFVRSADTLEAIIASGQATLAARAAAALHSPAVGAGEESFAASPLALSPAPSSPASSLPAIAWPASSADPRAADPRAADPRAPAPRADLRAMAPCPDPRAAAPSAESRTAPSRADPGAAASRADASAAPRAAPAPAPATTPIAAPRASLQPAAPATLSPSPRAPRFPAPQHNIAVGRFPSPPQRRGEKTPAFTPPNMPALSPEPMETAPASEPGPSYAAAAAAAKRPKTTPSGTAPVRAPAPAPAAAAATVDPSKTPKPKAARYPPLIVEVLPDWPTHFRELKRLLGHAPNGRPFGKGVRFIPKSDQEFRAIQRYLTQLESASGISWFCYSLPAERSLKVAIRGLPANTEPELVEAELRELGYVPEHVRTIPARPGRPGCLMFAQLQRTPDITPGIYESAWPVRGTTRPGTVRAPKRSRRRAPTVATRTRRTTPTAPCSARSCGTVGRALSRAPHRRAPPPPPRQPRPTHPARSWLPPTSHSSNRAASAAADVASARSRAKTRRRPRHSPLPSARRRPHPRLPPRHSLPPSARRRLHPRRPPPSPSPPWSPLPRGRRRRSGRARRARHLSRPPATWTPDLPKSSAPYTRF
ncbi:serine/arginine repetitive matrix protein 1-like [Maniola jurtina]|uniref:serine/arginine repetitive matrix protein 1-like n=1 Tax=Maniola jurtina TaxID=191418 RepID=UPI001E68951D|nr:serine/arginine repetitive matrix protein 1-like [Maniola jurtina]